MSFLSKALSHEGTPSSKRLAAFMVLTVTLLLEIISAFSSKFEGIDFDTLVTFLIFAATALGMTEFGKISEKIKK